MIIVTNKKTIVLFIVGVLAVLLVVSGFIFNRPLNTSEVMNNNPVAKPIDKGSVESKYIAFACNVDWGNEVLPDMLDTLKEKDVKITFFVTGRWAKTFPELFQSIIDEGHEIGSHGYQHLNYSTLDHEKNLDEIKRAENIIMEHTKEKPKYFAPPSGAYNQHTLHAAEELGYKTILWSIDTIDWRKGSTKDIIMKRVMDKEPFPGGIVLMHPMPETAKALPNLIDALREKGLEIGRITDILEE
ncbi:polysaccharide deacetylase family protein [Alkaliphilus hydrothermalis]|uniref:Sporulation protein (Polysaccharide deacetylase family) n=1 Tax=Alkaliphilus hydrothermalis TaxID=1482730 RepID=A0ABS2NMB5_9FIRM|nr:polysaccharide deacetylase family protein [Alkaliphilus hydrothermalis]MBM7613719.1 putative sporulation protein (polysaccharide deacetylase family) [Alkaliphilus hydrothermalis]